MSTPTVITGYVVNDNALNTTHTYLPTERRDAYAEARSIAGRIGKNVSVTVLRAPREAVSEAPSTTKQTLYEVVVPVQVYVNLTSDGNLVVEEPPSLDHSWAGFHSEAEESEGVWDANIDEWVDPRDAADVALVARRTVLAVLNAQAAASLWSVSEDLTGSMVAEVQDALNADEDLTDAAQAAVRRVVRALPVQTPLGQTPSEAARFVFDKAVGNLPGTDVVVTDKVAMWQRPNGTSFIGYTVSVAGIDLAVGVTVHDDGTLVMAVDLPR